MEGLVLPLNKNSNPESGLCTLPAVMEKKFLRCRNILRGLIMENYKIEQPFIIA